jgi:hypothetical protein
MIKNHYPTINKIIDEYEQDQYTLSTNKEIFIYYPKLFVLSAVSLFEQEIKYLINNIVTNPVSIIASLNEIVNQYSNNYIDRIYGKFIADGKSGIEILKAGEFYKIFGGNVFKKNIETKFATIKAQEISEYSHTLQLLTPLRDSNDKCENEYLKYDNILNKLNNLDFINAELSFLKLKLRRNKVAHNFLTGISDSFEDIRNLYYDAVLYIIALKQALKDLSRI